MISTDEALKRVLALVAPLEIEEVPLADGRGRVLARSLAARRSQPPFAASAMDGYALQGRETRRGAVFRVIGEAAAGRRFPGSVGPGEAVRIFTGAPVPDGADRVVLQEDMQARGGTVEIVGDPSGGTHIRPAAGDFAEGDAFPAPRLLDAFDLALLAAMNHAVLPVHRRPRVALIPTGDELVMPGETPGPDQIVASNIFGLSALLEAEGAECRVLPIARDRADSLGFVLGLAEDSDLVVTIGGASVGEHDLVRLVGEQAGLTLDFHRIAMRPGKPLMAGRLRGSPMVGLPGNPVSAMICGLLFLVPAVRRLTGLPPEPLPRAHGLLACDIGANGPREHFMRARILPGAAGDVARIMPAESQDSALLGVLADTDTLLVRPPGDPSRTAGSAVTHLPLNRRPLFRTLDTKREHE